MTARLLTRFPWGRQLSDEEEACTKYLKKFIDKDAILKEIMNTDYRHFEGEPYHGRRWSAAAKQRYFTDVKGEIGKLIDPPAIKRAKH